MYFRKKLGVAYYNQGFFNIGVEYSDYFGLHGTQILIELGEDNHVVSGYINRTANRNGTPRIMIGRPYTEWIQSIYSQGEYLTVEIKNPELLHLMKKSEKKGDK